MSVRLSLCLNSSSSKGRAQATILLPPPHSTEALLQLASNKLRISKKLCLLARLYVWRSGVELERRTSCASIVRHGDLIAVTLGEAYAGPAPACPPVEQHTASVSPEPSVEVAAPAVCGVDDMGREYASLSELWAEQAVRYAEYYRANAGWWDDDGYGGSADEEAMIGDGRSEEDIEHSLALLDSLRSSHPQ